LYDLDPFLAPFLNPFFILSMQAPFFHTCAEVDMDKIAIVGPYRPFFLCIEMVGWLVGWLTLSLFGVT
jgi:hypothetical protein